MDSILLFRGRLLKLDKNKLYKSDNYTQTRETKKEAMTSINSFSSSVVEIVKFKRMSSFINTPAHVALNRKCRTKLYV